MKKSREINSLGFVVIMAALVAFALLTAALDSFWLGLAIVLLPFVALAIYAWKVPERRPQIVAIFNFVKTKGVELLTEEQRATKAIESEKRSRKRIPAVIRNRVRERDKSCRYPGCSAELTSYETHHIDQDNTNSEDPKNLLLLCPNHHHVIHRTNRPPVSQSHIKQLRAWGRGNYSTTYQAAQQWGGAE